VAGIAVGLARVAVIVALLAAGAWLLNAGGDDRPLVEVDCDLFRSRSAAQEWFLGHGGPHLDPYLLDADGDGLACEPDDLPDGGRPPGSR
jgi:hypothetical protein